MQYELVKTITLDKLKLTGLYSSGEKSKPAIILIHGFTGDFYTNDFLQVIQEKLAADNIASIAIQNRGTGVHTEFHKVDGSGVFIGSFFEKLEEAHLDITAWIKFLLDQGYTEIILAGHSLGTFKTIRYLFEGEYKDKVSKIILLAPFDKNGFIERKTNGKTKEYVEIAKTKTAEGRGEEIIPKYYEDFAMSYQNFVSWYDESDLGSTFEFYKYGKYDFPILKKISIPVQVIVGDKDEYFYIPELSTIEDAKNSLKENIKDLDLNIIEGSLHSYKGFEEKVARLVVNFVNK
jgi:pimeloyl-ACP methyl ester carboxylesterase